MLNLIFNFTKKNKKIILILIIFLSILLRVFISKIGITYDLESFHIVGNLVNEGKNIYSETHRYNYGPIWAYILGFFKKISYFFDNNELIFRFLIILTLSLADILIAYWLLKEYKNFYLFIFFLFNPISIYTTGYHNQFDNLAISIALWSSFFISQKNIKKKFLGYFLLSISISIKHIFVFIIPWLFLKARNKKEKLLSIMPILIFIILFLPFSFSQKAIKGIWENVLTYKVASNIYSFFPFSGILRPLIILILFIISYFFIRKEETKKQFILYLLFITALSPIYASQYLIIPIIGHLIISPFLSILYILISSYFIFLKNINFLIFAKFVFQLSTLSLLIYFLPFLIKKIKIIIISLIIILNIFYISKIFIEIKNIYKEQRKEILIMRVFYPIKKVFKDKKFLKEPLTKNLKINGEFTAKENNLGFIAIPFKLENPSGVDFFRKNYQIGSSIITEDLKKYTEIRPIHTGLTPDGIILGFPIEEKSKFKKYQIEIFSTIPKNKDYINIDRHGFLETRYFLTKEIIKNPLILMSFLSYKIYYLFSLKDTVFLLLKIYIIFWVFINLFFLLKIKNKTQ